MSTGSDLSVTPSSSDLLPSTPSFLAFNCHNVDLVFEEFTKSHQFPATDFSRDQLSLSSATANLLLRLLLLSASKGSKR